MLILARNIHEGFKITTPNGELIEIYIKDITAYNAHCEYPHKNFQAKVGIIAPKAYDIVRNEIYTEGQEKFKKNSREALTEQKK